MARRNTLDEEIAKWSDPYWLDDDRGHRQFTFEGELLEPPLVKVYPEPSHRPPRARKASKAQALLPLDVSPQNDRPEPALLPAWGGALPVPIRTRFLAYEGEHCWEVADRFHRRQHKLFTADEAHTEAEGDMLAAQCERAWMALRELFLGSNYRSVRLWYCERISDAGVPLEDPRLTEWALSPPAPGPLPPAMPEVARIGRRVVDPDVERAVEIKARATTKFREVQQYQLRLAALWFEANRPLDALVPIKHIEGLQWVIDHADHKWWLGRGLDMIDPAPPPLHAQRVYCQRAMMSFLNMSTDASLLPLARAEMLL